MKKRWNLKINKHLSGKIAEWLCRTYMRLHGYRIVAKNYRCGSGKNTPYGELDFVAIRKKHIVFCEVKKRQKQTDFFKALSYRQQQRILRGGQYFLRKYPKYRVYAAQYDVFFVILPFSIRRIQNALYEHNS